MPDEHSRLKVVQALSEKLDPEVAAALMACVPPFSWTELATKTDLSEGLSSLEQRLNGRLDARLARAETRIIKWTVGGLFGSIAVISGAATAIAAIAR